MTTTLHKSVHLIVTDPEERENLRTAFVARQKTLYLIPATKNTWCQDVEFRPDVVYDMMLAMKFNKANDGTVFDVLAPPLIDIKKLMELVFLCASVVLCSDKPHGLTDYTRFVDISSQPDYEDRINGFLGDRGVKVLVCIATSMELDLITEILQSAPQRPRIRVIYRERPSDPTVVHCTVTRNLLPNALNSFESLFSDIPEGFAPLVYPSYVKEWWNHMKAYFEEGNKGSKLFKAYEAAITKMSDNLHALQCAIEDRPPKNPQIYFEVGKEEFVPSKNSSIGRYAGMSSSDKIRLANNSDRIIHFVAPINPTVWKQATEEFHEELNATMVMGERRFEITGPYSYVAKYSDSSAAHRFRFRVTPKSIDSMTGNHWIRDLHRGSWRTIQDYHEFTEFNSIGLSHLLLSWNMVMTAITIETFFDNNLKNGRIIEFLGEKGAGKSFSLYFAALYYRYRKCRQLSTQEKQLDIVVYIHDAELWIAEGDSYFLSALWDAFVDTPAAVYLGYLSSSSSPIEIMVVLWKIKDMFGSQMRIAFIIDQINVFYSSTFTDDPRFSQAFDIFCLIQRNFVCFTSSSPNINIDQSAVKSSIDINPFGVEEAVKNITRTEGGNRFMASNRLVYAINWFYNVTRITVNLRGSFTDDEVKYLLHDATLPENVWFVKLKALTKNPLQLINLLNIVEKSKKPEVEGRMLEVREVEMQSVVRSIDAQFKEVPEMLNDDPVINNIDDPDRMYKRHTFEYSGFAFGYKPYNRQHACMAVYPNYMKPILEKHKILSDVEDEFYFQENNPRNTATAIYCPLALSQISLDGMHKWLMAHDDNAKRRQHGLDIVKNISGFFDRGYLIETMKGGLLAKSVFMNLWSSQGKVTLTTRSLNVRQIKRNKFRLDIGESKNVDVEFRGGVDDSDKTINSTNIGDLLMNTKKDCIVKFDPDNPVFDILIVRPMEDGPTVAYALQVSVHKTGILEKMNDSYLRCHKLFKAYEEIDWQYIYVTSTVVKLDEDCRKGDLLGAENLHIMYLEDMIGQVSFTKDMEYTMYHIIRKSYEENSRRFRKREAGEPPLFPEHLRIRKKRKVGNQGAKGKQR